MHEPPGPHDPDHVIMPALLAACPSFQDVWPEIVGEWPELPGRDVYTGLGYFAHHLVSLLEQGETSEFASVFATVEHLFRDGDEGVRYAVKVGLLEDLGNIASNERGWPFAARFRIWFGPLATAAWDELHREWGTSDPGADSTHG